MSSQISPTAINAQFPVAGVNNNTQGFRDNFAATQNNFVFTAQDINDLLNKAVVTAPLNNGNSVVSNNLQGLPLKGAVLSYFSFAVVSHGTLTTTAIENFDFSLGYIHTITLNGAGAVTTVTPINIPANGSAPINIQITVSNTTHQLQFPAVTAYNVPGFNSVSNILSFNAAGTYFYTLSTPNGGTSWQLTSPIQIAQAQAYVPATSIGVNGDTAGMISYGNGNVYVCTANHNGVTNIWKYMSLSSF